MLFNVVNEKGLADYNSAPFSKPAQRAGKYLASTGCHPSNPYPPKWPYLLLRVPRRDIFRTLINLDILVVLPVGKGEVVCSIHTGSTTKTRQNWALFQSSMYQLSLGVCGHVRENGARTSRGLWGMGRGDGYMEPPCAWHSPFRIMLRIGMPRTAARRAM